MNAAIFLARKIGLKADKSGRLSGTGKVVSAISVAVSICVTVIAVAVAGGFRSQISDKARGFAADVVLNAPAEDITNTLYPLNSNLSYIGHLKALPFVNQVYGVSYKQGILKTDNQISGVVLKGVDSLYNLNFYQSHLYQGRVPDFSGKSASDEIIISKRLADIMQYNVGDKITAYFIGEEVKVRRFTLVGTFNAQLEQVDKYFALADIRHVSALNGWKNQVGGYEVFFKNPNVSMARNQNKLYNYVDQINNVIYKYTTETDSSVSITTLADKFYVLKDWLQLLDLNVLIIMVLMIMVAGFNMISGLLILLFERVSQIGLLKALGMTNRAVSGVFLVQGAAISLKGLFWGNLVAIIFCLLESKYSFISLSPDNYFVDSVPVQIGVWEILLLNIGAFAFIQLVLVLPCYFISKVSPATTMRVK